MEKLPAIARIINHQASFIQNELSKRPWDWQSAALTVVLVQIAATRLVISEWVPFLNVVEKLSFLAVVLGLVIGYSSFPRRQTIWIGIEYGLLLIPMHLLAAIERTDSLYLDLRGILIRLFDSFSLFAQNQPVYDTLFFVALSSLGFWIIGLHAGYQFARHRNFLNIVIPSGLVMLIVQTYDPWIPLRAWGLGVYIFITLVMLGRLNFLKNKTNWKTQRVFLTSDTEWDISRGALTFAAIAVFMAWALPGVLTSVKPITKAWNNFINPITQRLSDAVVALDAPYGPSTNNDFYSSNLSLGSNTPTSDTAVFFVKVDQIELAPVRYYWRGRIYDQYIDGQWSTTSVTRQYFDPESDELQPIDVLARNAASFTVTMNFPKQELMYAPSEIVWVNRESRLLTSPITDATREITAWLANPGLVAGESYEVRARIANPSINELRAAGVEYPAWTDRYLQIPEEIEPQLRSLAELVTKSSITPYDKAQAITIYLRNEIHYTTQLTESPPRLEDPVVWVLFEHKKGFCMYSASAEVLMLRTLGIPARMAVGFAEGEYDSQRERYTVARFDSHAWPEVYFPGIGWVEFEPTGNQDPLNRPQEPINDESNETNDANAANGPNNDEAQLESSGFNPSLLETDVIPTPTPSSFTTRFLYPGLLIGFLAIVVFFSRRYSLVDRLPVYLEHRYTKSGRQPPNWLARWSKWAILTPVERSFHSIDLSLRWLHYSQPAYSTSLERASALVKLLPSAQEAITILTQEHETTLFTSRKGNIIRARRAGLKIILETWRTRIFNYKETLKRRLN